MDDVFNHYGEMIPSDDCVTVFGLRILAYYNAEGILSFQMAMDQEVKVPISTTVGIMELAKHEIMLMNTLSATKRRRTKDDNDED